MPDVTGTGGQHQQLSQAAGGAAAAAVSGQELSHVGKAPDILRTEPVSSVPSSDRNLFMETGELAEEDVARVSQGQPSPAASNMSSGPASLPPMVGGPPDLPPMVGGNEQVPPGPPLQQRMVMGDHLPSSSSLPPIPNMIQPPPVSSSSVRLVEGDNNDSDDVQVMHVQPPPVLLQPPAPVSREVEGQSHPPAPALSAQQQLPRYDECLSVCLT